VASAEVRQKGLDGHVAGDEKAILRMALSPAGTDWTDEENDVLVASYFAMLADEMAVRPFVKRRQNAAVVAEIGRTRGSVEFKYRNVSAVLGKLGSPWINGYRPAMNAQFEALTAAINRYVSKSPGALEMDVPAPVIADLDLFVEPPTRNGGEDQTPEPIRRLARKFDPVARDARNRALGRKGEQFVLEIEERVLFAAGRHDLKNQVRWISDLDGDGAGYDILSFDPKSGSRKLIEVKTTCGDALTPFFMSRNEKTFAEERPEEFNLYRVFDFTSAPRIFTLRPPLGASADFREETWRVAIR
jgi:hypothetical protein